MTPRPTAEERVRRLLSNMGNPCDYLEDLEEFERAIEMEIKEAEAAVLDEMAKQFALPKDFELYNAQNEPCDTAVGHCSCGAVHTLHETLERVVTIARSYAIRKAGKE